MYALREHPTVQEFLYQIAELYLTLDGHAPIQFWALEFRSQEYSALVWKTDAGEWGAGEWRAGDTSTPEWMNMGYFVNRPAAGSLSEALEIVSATRPAPATTPPRRSWWRWPR